MARNERSVEDLIAELEGPAPSAGRPPRGQPPGGRARRSPAVSLTFAGRFLLAAVLLALGFGGGWLAAGLRLPAHGAAAAKPGKETRQELLAAGWQESDQGVFSSMAAAWPT